LKEFPAGSWIATGGAYSGEEIGDLCAWVTTGAGRSQNLVLTTGTFAVQSL
jgi:serine protease